MKHLPSFLLGLLLGLSVPAFVLERHRSEEEIVFIRDTIESVMPIARDSTVVRYVALPIRASEKGVKRVERERICTDSDSHACDTVTDDTIIIPITQKHYVDTAYEAWVSGFQPQLDSLRIFRQSIVAPVRQKHWHIGVSVGIGATSQGLSPYIGIGVTYSFFSF